MHCQTKLFIFLKDKQLGLNVPHLAIRTTHFSVLHKFFCPFISLSFLNPDMQHGGM